jgi:hypothetical protein
MLSLWDSGNISAGEVLSGIIEGLTDDNIAGVVDALPSEWRERLVADFESRAQATSPAN